MPYHLPTICVFFYCCCCCGGGGGGSGCCCCWRVCFCAFCFACRSFSIFNNRASVLDCVGGAGAGSAPRSSSACAAAAATAAACAAFCFASASFFALYRSRLRILRRGCICSEIEGERGGGADLLTGLPSCSATISSTTRHVYLIFMFFFGGVVLG